MALKKYLPCSVRLQNPSNTNISSAANGRSGWSAISFTLARPRSTSAPRSASTRPTWARFAGKVIAFEANPQVAAFAGTVTARNVQIVTAALSSKSGHATLKIPLNPKGQPIDELATIEPGNLLHASESGSMDVETKRLDDFNIANCSFIKIDVEYNEEAVLRWRVRPDRAAAPGADALELDEDPQQGRARRALPHATTRAAQLPRSFFLHSQPCPISEFDPGRRPVPANSSPARGPPVSNTSTISFRA